MTRTRYRLESPAALAEYRVLQRTGNLDLDAARTRVTDADEFTQILAETHVRNSDYRRVGVEIPPRCSEWSANLALCIAELFTSPPSALVRIDPLIAGCRDPQAIQRIRIWKVHMLLLVGSLTEGCALRDEVLRTGFDDDYPWRAESLTILALSLFESNESRAAIEMHRMALKAIEREPEVYHQTLGSATAMRACLKVFDPSAFQLFSDSLDAAMRVKADERYLLRQHAYRATVLTLLGECRAAQRDWSEGDRLLERIDVGQSTIERGNYLLLRVLAACLLGDMEAFAYHYENARREIVGAAVPPHLAELEVCRVVAPIVAARREQVGLRAMCGVVERAASELGDLLSNFPGGRLDRARLIYADGIEYCASLLGEGRAGSGPPSRRDRYSSLLLSIVNNLDASAEFAKDIAHFRLVPKFVDCLESALFDSRGVLSAFAEVTRIEPQIENGKIVATGSVVRSGELENVARLANVLLDLEAKARHNAEISAIAKTTQMLAHDVRKPFSLVQAILETIGGMTEPDEMREAAELLLPEVRAALMSVNRMIEDVMDVGRDVMPCQRQPCDVEGILAEALERAFLSMSTADIGFHYTLAHRTKVSVDRDKVVRVLTNLVDNAAHAMQMRGEMWFETRAISDTNSRFVEVCVGNVGSPIDPADAPRLFDAFFTKGKPRGTGLGLAICKRIVSNHGGRIACVSRDGKTEFRFTLPASTELAAYGRALPGRSQDLANLVHKVVQQSRGDSASKAEEMELEARVLELGTARPGGFRVLVVDDEWVYSTVLVRYLSRSGALSGVVEARTATDAEGALRHVSQWAPDLVIVDVDLGARAVDGFQLVRQLRKLYPHVSICIHTNREWALYHGPALAAGADMFLPKPMTRTHLLKLIAGVARAGLHLPSDTPLIGSDFHTRR